MIEKFVAVETPDGEMDALVTYPENGERCSAIIIFMDIWGLREELFDVARKIGTAGYYCILPNTYYRQGKVRFEHRNERGEMRSMDTLAPEVQESVRVHMHALTDEMVVEDMKWIIRFLEHEPIRTGPMGVLGYCMGGRHALKIAGHYPNEMRATASLHGTRLVTDAPDSVHLLSKKFRGEIYCGFAERDLLAPLSTIETLAKHCAGQPDFKYSYLIHPDTEHGYSLPDRDIYRKHAANRDWERIFAMFRRQLRSPTSADGYKVADT